MSENVIKFLNPGSIAVIGVSHDTGKIGRIIYSQLIKNKKKVFGINPNLLKIGSQKIYPDINSLPEIPELALYAIPANIVVQTLEEAAKKGVKNHLIISSGFSESDNKGRILEEKIIRIKNQYGLNIQGPNCLGNISTVYNFNASFSYQPQKGNIGLILQSGAIGTSFFDWSHKENFGVSHFISLGNKIDLSETDFLDFMANDINTKVIGLYLESIKDPESFIRICKKYSGKKPIIILKAGESKEAKIAVSSHTGAMAGQFSAQIAAFTQCNLIIAGNLEEFFYLLVFFSKYYKPQLLKEALIITNAGGPAVLTVDELVKNRINLFKIPLTKIKKLNMILPPNAQAHNPVDMLGDADPVRLENVLKIIRPKSFSPLTILHLTPQEDTDLTGMAKMLIKPKYRFKGVLIVNILGGNQADTARIILKKNKIICFDFTDDFIRLLSKIDIYEIAKKVIKHEISNYSVGKKIVNILSDIKIQKEFLPENLSLKIADIYNIPLPKTYFINNLTQAEKLIKSIGFPVVLKISDKSIIHRNKENGVFLNISSQEMLETAYKTLRQKKGNIIMQKMINADAEIIIGAKRDREFKYLIMFGSGGIHTEYLKDITFGVLPQITYEDFYSMIEHTKISALIKNKKIFKSVFTGLCTLLTDLSMIDEIDLNPVIISGNKLYCVDIKIKI